jgi:hypothetical protein
MRHIDGKRLRAALEHRVAGRRGRRSADDEADAHAVRFTERLQDAILDLETREHGFEWATRKADHVEELRRVLGILLDTLADWEMLADRMG